MKKIPLQEVVSSPEKYINAISENDEVFSVEIAGGAPVVLLPQRQYQVLVNALKFSHAVAFSADEFGTLEIAEALALMEVLP